MTLTIEQLEVLSKALHGPDLDYHQLSITGEAVRALDMEIERRKHGPFTFAEARASGKLYRRPQWKGWAASLRCGYDGHEFLGEGDEHITYLDDEEMDACDYELQPEGGE